MPTEQDNSLLHAFKKGRQNHDKTYNVMVDMLESHMFLTKKIDDIAKILEEAIATDPQCKSCKNLIQSIQTIVEKKLNRDASLDSSPD